MVALIGAMFVVLAPAKAQTPPYAALNLVVDFPEDSDDTIRAGTSTKVRLRLVATDLSSRVVFDAEDAKVGDWASLSYDFAYGDASGAAADEAIASSLTYLRVSDGLILTAGTETGIVLSDGEQALRDLAATAADVTEAAVTAGTNAAHVAEIGSESLKVIVPAGVDPGSAVVSASVVAGVTITYTQYIADTDTDADTDPDAGTDTTSIFIPLERDTDDDGDVDADDTAGGELGLVTAANSSRNGSGTINIGNIDEVNSISFGRSSPKRDSSTTSGYSDDPGTTEPQFVSTAGGTTEFTLHIFNANDKPSQINSVSSVVVSTTSGTFSSDHSTDASLNSGGQCGGSSTTCELEPLRTAGAALPKTGLRFLLAAPTSSGTADIRVVVISRAGNVLIDDEQTVTFHGPAASLEIGDASGTVLGYDVVGKNSAGNDKQAKQDGDTNAGKTDDEGVALDPAGDADKGAAKRDQISFSVSAADKGGTTVGTPKLSAKITGPDGKAISNDKFEISQSGDLSDTLHLDIDTAATKALDAGAYQIKVSAGALSASGSFTVVHTADGIEVEVSDSAPSGIGDQVVVTATVTSDGEPVADGTEVMFRSRDKTGDTDSVLIATTSETPGTKGGTASVTYVTVGDGSAVITATVSDDTTPVVNVQVIQSSAGAAAPVAEEVSLACLTETSGFSVYNCGAGSTASELFALVSGRGATAIHLWNGSSWVRYSVVDGSEVPGSSDFDVTENDILYVSN